MKQFTLYRPAQEILEVMAKPSSKGSDKTPQMRSLPRAFAVCKHKALK